MNSPSNPLYQYMIPHSHRRSLPVRGKEKSLRSADLGGGGVSSAEPAEAGEGACSDGTAVCDRAAASVRHGGTGRQEGC